jgi:hypothetical protein
MIRSTLVTSLLVVAGTAAADDTPPYGGPAADPNEDDPTQETSIDPAQGDPATPPPSVYTPPPAPTYYEPDPEDRRTMLERLGMSISAGGGVAGFTDSAMRDTTNDGGNWDVRATFGTRSPIAIEGAYIGSAQAIDALGLDQDAILIGNGVQGNLRLNALPKFPVQPFAFGGVAWRRYTLTNTDTNTSALADDDDVLEFPVGVGVAYRYEGFLLDARGEIRFATNEDMVPDLDGDLGSESMHRYGVNANVGYEF